MTVLKVTRTHTKQGRDVSTKYLQKHLEIGEDGHPRALAHDFVCLSGERECRDWGLCMDETRRFYDNDCGWRGHEGVLFWHFVIIPDPHDEIDLETLRKLTMDWVTEWFGDTLTPGKLGSYEVAVVYLDDNEKRTLHSHVVVNNTNFETGQRLRIGNKVYKKEFFDSLQKIARSYGLHYFERGTRGELKQSRYVTLDERLLERDGKHSWRSDLCDRIDKARKISASSEQFIEELAALDVSLYEKDEDWIYSLVQNPQQWKIRGRLLGKDYTKSFIEEQLAQKANEPIKATADLVE